jgi:hypothetical protein
MDTLFLTILSALYLAGETPSRPLVEYGLEHGLLTPSKRALLHSVSQVNDPLRYEGVTMYQTDWNLASLQARVDGGAPFRLPMAILDNGEVRKSGGFWVRPSDASKTQEMGGRDNSLLCSRTSDTSL